MEKEAGIMKRLSALLVITLVVSMLELSPVQASATTQKTQYNNSYGEQLANDYGKALYNAFIERFVYTESSAGNENGSLTGLAIPVDASEIIEIYFEDFYKEVTATTKDEALQIVSKWAKEKRAEINQEVNAALDAFVKDYPQVYWLSGASFKVIVSTLSSVYSDRCEVEADLTLKITPREYFVGADQYIEEVNSGIVAAQSRIINEYSVNENSNDSEILRAIHNYLCDTLTYNYKAAQDGESGFEYAHTVLPVFTDNEEWNHSVVCEGYAKAFKILADRMGVQTAIMIGTATNPEGELENHMWNVAKIDGNWYAVDATWDDQGAKVYDTYFLAGNKTVGMNGVTFDLDHTPFNVFSESSDSSTFVLPEISDRGYFYDENEETTTEKATETTTEATNEPEVQPTKSAETTTEPATSENKVMKIDVRYSETYRYTGKAIKCSITVLCNGKKLVADKDYTVVYSNNVKPGKATAIIVFKGDYSYVPNYLLNYSIKKISVNSLKCTNLKLKKAGKGKYAVKSISIKVNGKKLKAQKDYSLKYKCSKKLLTITVTGKGVYSGKKVIKVKIR